jgi:hypothetical protein
MRKTIAITAIALLGLAACGSDDAGRTSEEDTAEKQLTQFLESQPIPIFNYSQLRQNLIEIETAQANATATTSFFFNLGIEDPIHSCPSIGFPIPGTFQLSNPQQKVGGTNGNVTLPQLEANGVYTGDTTATTVICVDAEGKGYASYWEGFVSTVAGPAEWDTETKTVVLTGAPTAEFSTSEE